MGLDLRQQLAMEFPEKSHQTIFFEQGCVHPPYNDLDLNQSLERFCLEFLPRSPFLDPRGKEVKVVKNNFTKLVDLEHRTLTREEFNASRIVEQIEAGALKVADYREMDQSRIRTLFWLPDVICQPDAIYKNGHKIIAGDEVYVRVYDKMGSKVKLVFTMDIHSKGRLVRTVPVTSFLTDPKMALNYVSGQPRYRASLQKPLATKPKNGASY